MLRFTYSLSFGFMAMDNKKPSQGQNSTDVCLCAHQRERISLTLSHLADVSTSVLFVLPRWSVDIDWVRQAVKLPLWASLTLLLRSCQAPRGSLYTSSLYCSVSLLPQPLLKLPRTLDLYRVFPPQNGLPLNLLHTSAPITTPKCLISLLMMTLRCEWVPTVHLWKGVCVYVCEGNLV